MFNFDKYLFYGNGWHETPRIFASSPPSCSDIPNLPWIVDFLQMMFVVTSGIVVKHVHMYFIRNMNHRITWQEFNFKQWNSVRIHFNARGARWLSGRVSDSGARGPGFETYLRRVVSMSKTLYSPKVLVNYPGSDGSVPTWLKNCWQGR